MQKDAALEVLPGDVTRAGEAFVGKHAKAGSARQAMLCIHTCFRFVGRQGYDRRGTFSSAHWAGLAALQLVQRT